MEKIKLENTLLATKHCKSINYSWHCDCGKDIQSDVECRDTLSVVCAHPEVYSPVREAPK